MSRIGERIEELSRSHGGMGKLASISGIPKSSLYDYKSKDLEIPTAILVKLSDSTGVSIDWLISGLHRQDKVKTTATKQDNLSIQKVPILGTAAGSAIGSLALSDTTIEYISRPRGLEGVPDAYGLYVTGSSMAPRYNEGEIIFVHPGKPVLQNNIVIIQQQSAADGERTAFIKEFVSRSDGIIKARQYNPDELLEFDPKTITSIHRVLSPNEIVGV